MFQVWHFQVIFGYDCGVNVGAISFQFKMVWWVLPIKKKYILCSDHYGGSLHLHHIKNFLVAVWWKDFNISFFDVAL
jgi:hypothetical protein